MRAVVSLPEGHGGIFVRPLALSGRASNGAGLLVKERAVPLHGPVGPLPDPPLVRRLGGAAKPAPARRFARGSSPRGRRAETVCARRGDRAGRARQFVAVDSATTGNSTALLPPAPRTTVIVAFR